ncbi:MAG: hypothetical protein R3B99_05290 [Polyangiales bacterium]
MKPWSVAPRASAPPAATAASRTASTAARDSASNAKSPSIAREVSQSARGVNVSKKGFCNSITYALSLTIMHAA